MIQPLRKYEIISHFLRFATLLVLFRNYSEYFVMILFSWCSFISRIVSVSTKFLHSIFISYSIMQIPFNFLPFLVPVSRLALCKITRFYDCLLLYTEAYRNFIVRNCVLALEETCQYDLFSQTLHDHWLSQIFFKRIFSFAQNPHKNLHFPISPTTTTLTSCFDRC